MVTVLASTEAIGTTSTFFGIWNSVARLDKGRGPYIRDLLIVSNTVTMRAYAYAFSRFTVS